MTSELARHAAVRVGPVIARTEAEGPGVRFAVWAQGCTIRCSGCFNPHLWASQGGRDIAVSELSSKAIAAGVEGVTFLGGEPFEQAEGFAALAREVRAAGLSVMVFTGFEREHLEGPDAPEGSAELLAATDLLIDGPYRSDSPDPWRPWVGSTNQRFHFLTERYKGLESSLAKLPDRVEVRIAPSGEVAVNGWAPVQLLDALLADITPPIGRGKIR